MANPYYGGQRRLEIIADQKKGKAKESQGKPNQDSGKAAKEVSKKKKAK